MASMAAKMFGSYLESKDVKFQSVEDDILRVGWGLQVGSSISIFFHFQNEDTSVHLEGLDFVKIPEDKYDMIYKLLNELNDRYKHVKFVLNAETGMVAARDDDVIQLDTCCEECWELMIRMVQIVEDAYPIFMKALWA